MNKKGFTIIEVITSASIGAIVLAVVYLSFLAGQQIHQRGVMNAELAQNGRIALDRITRELRQTGEITTALEENEPITPQTEIQFEDGHNEEIQYITYYLDGTELKREIGHYYFPSDPNTWVYATSTDSFGNLANYEIDDEQTVSQFITKLTFYGISTININLTVSKNDRSINLKTQVLGRNL